MEIELQEWIDYLASLRAGDYSASAYRLELQRKEGELRERLNDDKEPG